MAVVCGKGTKNRKMPINTGTLRFRILKICSLVFCSFNRDVKSVDLSIYTVHFSENFQKKYLFTTAIKNSQ